LFLLLLHGTGVTKASSMSKSPSMDSRCTTSQMTAHWEGSLGQPCTLARLQQNMFSAQNSKGFVQCALAELVSTGALFAW